MLDLWPNYRAYFYRKKRKNKQNIIDYKSTINIFASFCPFHFNQFNKKAPVGALYIDSSIFKELNLHHALQSVQIDVQRLYCVMPQYW